MINFFRKIRQRLLTENKFSKYLLYAIGEIVLVVIGILIALSINNWNINRISDKQMIIYLGSLKKDLSIDTLNFSKAINNYSKEVDIRNNLMPLSNYENIPTDSIFQLIVPYYGTQRSISNTFNKITNSGITQISKNDSLSQKIYDYYTTRFENFNGLLDWDKEMTTLDAGYWIYGQNLFEIKWTNGKAQLQDKDASRANLIKLMSEPKGRNRLNLNYLRKKRILANYLGMKEIAIELIAEIDEELKSE
jgi:hypothetical protein